jgi:hypothetical protein
LDISKYIDATNLALLVPMLMLWWGLATCLLGYLIIRVNLVIVGVLLGAWAGAMLALWRAQARGLALPSGADLFVLCGSLSVISAVAAWYAWRVVLSIATAAAVCMVIVYIRIGFATAPPPHEWLVGVVPGIIVGLAVLIWSRRLTVVLSALAGAAVAVGSAALVLTEGQEGLKNWLGGAKLDAVPIAVLAGAIVALAAGGMRLQFRLPTLASKWFKPPEKKEKGEKPVAKPAPAA